MDFVGFTYNGKHSIRDLKIYRTSDGSRYTEDLTPQMIDKTVDVPGSHGQYYFGTTYKGRTFNVSYAFDELTEAGLSLLKEVFNGDGIHDLIFDETPYKVWSAKVTGTAQIKHICFEENGERIYKGEGSITFTCYYPFAHTPIEVKHEFSGKSDVPVNIWIRAGVVAKKGGYLTFDAENFEILYCEREGDVWGEQKETVVTSGRTISSTSDIYIESVRATKYNLSYFVYYPPGGISSTCTLTYTYNECFEHNKNYNGRDINAYSIYWYPNKKEWAIASNLTTPAFNNLTKLQGAYNLGQIPAPFELKADSVTFETAEQLLKIGDCQVTITVTPGTYKNFVWNSKTGIIKAEDTAGKTVYFPYTGDSIGIIPLNSDGINIDYPRVMTLDYQYWYY